MLLAGCRPAPPEPQVTAPPRPPPVETPAAPRPQCLGEPRLMEVGDVPTMGLHTADVTGDGKLDLLGLADVKSGNAYFTGLTVYPGDGKGGFAQGLTLDVGNLVVEVALGDVDEDGDLDIVLPQYREKKVAVLRNNGIGKFDAPKGIGVSRKPAHAMLVDLDADRHLDIVVSSQEHLAVLRGDGAGGFKALGKPVKVGQAPDWPVVADLDRDGAPDLYVPMNDDSTFHVLRGDGQGGLAAMLRESSCDSPTGPATGDLNEDGTVDVAYVCNGADVELRITGDAGLGVASVSAAPSEAVAVADVTGDGNLDLVTMGEAQAFAGSTLRVHPGSGDGRFGEPLTVKLDAHVDDPAAGDFDGDGRIDLAVTWWTGHAPAAIAIYSPLVVDCAR